MQWEKRDLYLQKRKKKVQKEHSKGKEDNRNVKVKQGMGQFNLFINCNHYQNWDLMRFFKALKNPLQNVQKIAMMNFTFPGLEVEL